MSKQTPIAKAIEQLKERIKDSNYALYAKGCEDAIDILTDLLPYEREVIEEAYNQGSSDEIVDNEFQQFAGSTDYFTKTFTDNEPHSN